MNLMNWNWQYNARKLLSFTTITRIRTNCNANFSLTTTTTTSPSLPLFFYTQSYTETGNMNVFQIEKRKKKEKKTTRNEMKEATRNNNTPHSAMRSMYIVCFRVCLHICICEFDYRQHTQNYYRDLSYNKSFNNHMTYELIKCTSTAHSFTQTQKRKRTHSHRGTLSIRFYWSYVHSSIHRFRLLLGFFSFVFFSVVQKKNLSRDQVSISCFAYVHLCSRALSHLFIYSAFQSLDPSHAVIHTLFHFSSSLSLSSLVFFNRTSTKKTRFFLLLTFSKL